MKLKIKLSSVSADVPYTPTSVLKDVPINPMDKLHEEEFARTGRWGRQGAGSICLAMDTGRILLSHRSAGVLEPHTWGTYGGAVDPGETPLQCALRELTEEAGYVAKENQMRPLWLFEDHKTGFRYHNFLCIVPHEFHPHGNWEVQGAKWVEYGDWPTPLHPGMKALIQHTKQSDYQYQKL